MAFVPDAEPTPTKSRFIPDEPAAAPASKPLAANAGAVRLAAGLLGMPVDALENVLNLGIAGYGRLTGKGGDAPEPISGSFGGSKSIENMLRSTGMPGLNPDNPDPSSKLGTTQYNLMARGGAIPGGFLPAVGSMVAEKIGGPQWAGVGAMVPGAVGQVVRETVGPAMQEAGRNLMQSALKPNISELRTGKAAKAIDTMLEGGFNATKGGVEKMRSQIDELNAQITQAISQSPATVNKMAVGNELRTLLARVKNQVNPDADLKAVRSAWQEFMDHPLLQGTHQIPVQTAQELKQGTYKALGNKSYGELKGAEIEAQKTLARGLKDQIARAVPEISNLNARESALLNAASIAERRALLDGNRNPLGLAPLGHSLPALMSLLADKSALAKSLAARGLYSAGQPGALSNTSPIISRGVLAELLAEQENR